MTEISTSLPLHFYLPKPVDKNKPLFIYFPGMDGSGKLLHTQVDDLEEFFDLRCLTIPVDDLSPWDVLTDGVINLIERERKKSSQRRLYLCGESFGGCLALSVAIKAPWLFERLILINPASSYNQRPWLNWGVQMTQWIPETIHRYSSLGLLPFLASLNNISPPNRRALINSIKSIPLKTIFWRIALVKNFVVDENRLKRVTQPVLLIGSARDRLLPSLEEVYRLFTIFPNSKIRVLNNSGHACLIEKEVKLTEILQQENFLDNNFKALNAAS